MGAEGLEASSVPEGMGTTLPRPPVRDRQFLKQHHLPLSGNGPLGKGPQGQF